MSEQAQQIAAAIDQHAANIGKFRRGEITPDQFRPLRLAMGVYAQLAHVKHMQRIKVPGGRVTAAQLEALAEVTERWGRSLAHVTTRQDLQLHYLEMEETVELQQRLAEAGVVTIGACADTIRNVTASPFAGVIAEEAFDTTPHAQAITDHFLFHEHNRRLPRKFKIGLSGSARDLAQVMINDLGAFAVVTDQGRGFRVYIAGGLGSTPEIAHLWRDFLPEAELLAACEAVVSVFHRDGERKNRKKARLKFLLRKLGEAELLARLDAELLRIQAERGPALAAALTRAIETFQDSAPPPLEADGVALGDAAFARWQRTNTVAQIQAGYRAVTVKLALGDVTSTQMRALAGLARAFGDGELRTTNTQNFILRWVPEGRLVRLHRELGLIGLAEPDAGHITDVVACPGADYCSLAITKSMGVATKIREHLAPEGSRASADDLIQRIGEFEIKISGCPNSCGQHHVADLGMTGLMIKDPEGNETPYYSLRVGGGVGPNARIGDRLDGRVREEDTPRVIAAIGRYYLDERGDGETFKDFVGRVGAQAIGRAGFDGIDGVI